DPGQAVFNQVERRQQPVTQFASRLGDAGEFGHHASRLPEVRRAFSGPRKSWQARRLPHLPSNNSVPGSTLGPQDPQAPASLGSSDEAEPRESSVPGGSLGRRTKIMAGETPAPHLPSMDTNQRPELIDPTAFIAPGAVVLGDVTIGAEATVWFNAVIRGD